MWRFSKNNGITEGFHNKMEVISRRAYGFRNFENYRLRVLTHCGWAGLAHQRDYQSGTDECPSPVYGLLLVCKGLISGSGIDCSRVSGLIFVPQSATGP